MNRRGGVMEMSQNPYNSGIVKNPQSQESIQNYELRLEKDNSALITSRQQI